MTALAWPIVALAIAALVYRAFHRYLAQAQVTKAHEEALDTLTQMHTALQREVGGIEMRVANRIKAIEDRVSAENSLMSLKAPRRP